MHLGEFYIIVDVNVVEADKTNSFPKPILKGHFAKLAAPAIRAMGMDDCLVFLAAGGHGFTLALIVLITAALPDKPPKV